MARFWKPKKNPLKNRIFYPRLKYIPDENDLDLRYFKENWNGAYARAAHCCALGEICLGPADPVDMYAPGADVGRLLHNKARQRTDMKDAKGNKLTVYFYHDNGAATDKNLNFKHLKSGNCLFLHNVERRTFLDLSYGIRVEDLQRARVIRLSLDEVLAACDAYFEHRKTECWSCESPAPPKSDEDAQNKIQRCSGCKVAVYCNTECQTEDWNDRHKKWCKELPKIAKMVDFKYRSDDCSEHILDFAYEPK